MGQSRISSHLAQLRQAGLVQDRRAGKNIYYALATNAVHEQFASIIAASAKEIPAANRDAKALQLLLKKRQDKAREYFNQLAGNQPCWGCAASLRASLVSVPRNGAAMHVASRTMNRMASISTSRFEGRAYPDIHKCASATVQRLAMVLAQHFMDIEEC